MIVEGNEGAASFEDLVGELAAKGMKGWPPVLQKAVYDPYDYYLVTRSGLSFWFSKASYLNPRWVLLEEVKAAGDQLNLRWGGVQFGFERGVELRVSEIVFVADYGK
jgi:hypothetical protein